MSADGLGNVYISGITLGSLGGPNAGYEDPFVAKYIPEPSTLVLLGIGAIGLLGWAWRRRWKLHGLSGMVLAVAVACCAVASQADTITHPNASGGGSTTINMDFVNVGNAGNGADTRVMNDRTSGYGAVGYSYRIGTYEVTAADWAAVIAADPNVGNAGYWNGSQWWRDWSGSQPTAGISWNEAAKFCNWLTTGNANSGSNTNPRVFSNSQKPAQTP